MGAWVLGEVHGFLSISLPHLPSVVYESVICEGTGCASHRNIRDHSAQQGEFQATITFQDIQKSGRLQRGFRSLGCERGKATGRQSGINVRSGQPAVRGY